MWRASGSPEPAADMNPFGDVSADAYYYKAVLWAVENGIVKGTSATTFSPDDLVTRGQIIACLWREKGEPAVKSGNVFVDVSFNAYYYTAIMWAAEHNITQGTSSTEFSPAAACTRGQIVTFLYKSRDLK